MKLPPFEQEPGRWGHRSLRGLGLVPKSCGMILASARGGGAYKRAASLPEASEHLLVAETELPCSAAAAFDFISAPGSCSCLALLCSALLQQLFFLAFVWLIN